MKVKILAIILFALAYVSCDDDTSSLGVEMMPEGDRVEVSTGTYEVTTASILADSIMARTSTAYLGMYTDPYTGTVFNTDFIAQFNCLENFEFPDSMLLDEDGKRFAELLEIRLYFTEYYGDSLNVQTAEVYPLTTTLSEDEVYYTNINPEDYYDVTSEPMVSKIFTAADMSISDSARWDEDHYDNVRFILPTEYGTEIIRKYFGTDDNGVDHVEEGKLNFQNARNFINNVCKGFYFKCTHGDGTVLYIDQVIMNLYFEYYTENYLGVVDSLVTGVAQFAATQEVLQVNRFETAGLDVLIDDDECTYLQTPAGIFTEVTLPIDQLDENDTINSAELILTRYNTFNENTYRMGIPETLLMVPKSEMYDFFEDNNVPDNESTYYTTFDSDYNQYDFSNIAYLVNALRSKKRNNPNIADEDPDWNKVVLIPVTLVTQTINYTSTVVSVRHDLQMNFAKLVGNKDKLELKVIYSKFKDME